MEPSLQNVKAEKDKEKLTTTGSSDGRLKRHNSWNKTGDLGLDPGPEIILLQGKMGEIWIKYMNWIIIFYYC